MTWLLVTMYPAPSTTTPEPVPDCSPCATWMETTDGRTASATAAICPTGSSPSSPDCDSVTLRLVRLSRSDVAAIPMSPPTSPIASASAASPASALPSTWPPSRTSRTPSLGASGIRAGPSPASAGAPRRTGASGSRHGSAEVSSAAGISTTGSGARWIESDSPSGRPKASASTGRVVRHGSGTVHRPGIGGADERAGDVRRTTEGVRGGRIHLGRYTGRGARRGPSGRSDPASAAPGVLESAVTRVYPPRVRRSRMPVSPIRATARVAARQRRRRKGQRRAMSLSRSKEMIPGTESCRGAGSGSAG